MTTVDSFLLKYACCPQKYRRLTTTYLDPPRLEILCKTNITDDQKS